MDYRAIVEQAGARFCGVIEGHVWFDLPSRSTGALPMEDFTAERMRTRVAEDDLKGWKSKTVVSAEAVQRGSRGRGRA